MIVRRSPRRRGYSLVEMLVVMTCLSVLLAISTMLIRTLIRAEASGRREVDEHLGLSRLAEAFRRDVHAAVEAKRTAEKATAGLDLVGPDGTVRYRLDGDDAVIRSLGERRELYRIRRGTAAAFAVDPLDGRTFAAMSLRPTSGADSANGPLRPVRIRAELGRDRREGREAAP